VNRMAFIGLWLVLCFAAFDRAAARTLPYWQQGALSDDEAKAREVWRKRLLKQYGNDPVLVTHQLMAAGWVLIVRGGPNTAIKRVNEAAVFSPDDPSIPHGIMVAAGLRGDDAGEITEAFERAMALSDRAAQTDLQRDFGEVMLSLDHSDRALSAFRASLSGGAEPGLLMCIARLFYAKGQKEVARLYFNWAERITP